MVFNIVPQPDKVDKYGMRALLTIGDWTETLYLRLEYWTLNRYLAHWKREVRKIVSGEVSKSCLFVGMKHPRLAKKTIEGWPMWRVGDKVIFNNVHFIMSVHRDKFQIDNPGAIIRDFEPDESKRTGQEWTCSVSDLEEWLRQQD
jgi:hypothetical protein